MDAPARVERALTGSEPGFLPLEDGAMEQMEEFESSSLGWQPNIITSILYLHCWRSWRDLNPHIISDVTDLQSGA